LDRKKKEEVAKRKADKEASKKKGNKSIVAVGESTTEGVPGAGTDAAGVDDARRISEVSVLSDGSRKQSFENVG
jgi:hypothetical protein